MEISGYELGQGNTLTYLQQHTYISFGYISKSGPSKGVRFLSKINVII